MDLDKALECFRDRVVGTKIRGLTVENVDLTIETDGKNPMRFFLTAIFTEPDVPSEVHGNLQLLRRVFNDVHFAVLQCDGVDDARDRMLGRKQCLQSEWILEDETSANSN